MPTNKYKTEDVYKQMEKEKLSNRRKEREFLQMDVKKRCQKDVKKGMSTGVKKCQTWKKRGCVRTDVKKKSNM